MAHLIKELKMVENAKLIQEEKQTETETVEYIGKLIRSEECLKKVNEANVINKVKIITLLCKYKLRDYIDTR